jgi:hypothetical protein
MRKRIKIRLDAEGIEIPFPHQTVYWGEAQPPFRPDLVADAVRDVSAPGTAKSGPVFRPAPSQHQPAAAPSIKATTTGSRDGDLLTPERREELLAAVAMATASRVSDAATMDIKARTLFADIADNE